MKGERFCSPFLLYFETMMDKGSNYLEINRQLWDARTPHHIKSDFYDMDGFMQGASSLKEIELGLLGDVKDKSILHLQCHFGQDSLSLARAGARVTGVDFSEEAIRAATDLAGKLSLPARFICSDVYALAEQPDEKFDIVYTSYGVLGWLPDMKRWAGVVARFLKPGGKLVLVEFHPVVWMFDNNFTHIKYSYFNKETIIEDEEGTYADKEARIKLESVSWNHGTAEVLQRLINEGLVLRVFNEYDYSPYACFKNMVSAGEGRHQLVGLEGKIPLVYAVVAEKSII